jgi:hypothetical protein
MQTLSPPLLSQWYLGDVTQRSLLLARKTFDFLFDPTCNIRLDRRMNLSSRIAAGAMAFDSRFLGSEHYSQSFLSLWLLRRLQRASFSGQEEADSRLGTALQSALPLPDPHADVLWVIQTVSRKAWTEEDMSLQVKDISYLFGPC